MINKEGSFANLIGLKGPIFERRVSSWNAALKVQMFQSVTILDSDVQWLICRPYSSKELVRTIYAWGLGQ